MANRSFGRAFWRASAPQVVQAPQLDRNDVHMAPVLEDDEDSADFPPMLTFNRPQQRITKTNELFLPVEPFPDALLRISPQSGLNGEKDVESNGQRGGLIPQQSSVGVTSLRDLEVVRTLGRGSTAVVQLVRHKETGRLFALKVMHMSIEEPVRSQIRRELQINQKQRENVVDCYHTFYDNANISIVLEYMDGGSLADIIANRGKIPEPYLAEVARQALHALMMLHKDHIIHRDIKPSNILLNQKGEVKVTDFGVSTLLTSTLDVGNSFVGTYTYMSPERISGEAYSYNSDTWALGLTILECAIGHFAYQPPKGGTWDSFYALLNTVVLQPAPQAPAEEFSLQFCSFISDCLQKDPALRPTAAQALQHPFIILQAGEGVNAGDLCRR